MISICFYTSECYPRTLVNRLGNWLISLWSRPYIHTDIRVDNLVLSADLHSGRVSIFEARDCPEPACKIALDFDEVRATQVFHEYQDLAVRYGWLDFLLVPFRRWCSFNGKGVICSELVALALIRLAELAQDSRLSGLARALEQQGAHTLTPQDVYQAVLVYESPGP